MDSQDPEQQQQQPQSIEEPTKHLLGRVLNTSNPNHNPIPEKSFSITQWNILNNRLCDKKAFPKIEEQYLDYGYRKDFLKQEIENLNSDIYCFEEVSHDQYEFFQSFMHPKSKIKYDSLYNLKKSGLDGLAFFYRTDKFELIDNLNGRYTSEDGHLHNQVYQINLLKLIQSQDVDRYILVAFSHFKAKEEGAEARKIQSSLLAKIVDIKTEEYQKRFGSEAQVATILCGDLNDEPESRPIEIINLRLGYNSAYQGEAFTTYKQREKEACRVIDYLFFSKHLQVNQKLAMPSKDSIGPLGLPNQDYPSDHLSLYASFEFTNKMPKQNNPQ